MFFIPKFELTIAARKSQIAIEYSYRLVERSSQLSTFWVHASSKQRFEDSYEKIVTEVKIAGIGDGKVDTLQVVSNWLANQDNGPWLLILDNADEAAVLLHPPESDTGTGTSSVQRRLLDFLPRVQHGAVLITSRDRTCVLALTGSCGAPIKVQSMSTSEAVALLRNKLPDAIEEEAAKLVKELENVPLAVSQASAYIKEVSLASIPTYLEKFRRSNEDQAALLNKHKEDLRRDSKVSNAVVTSWELSFKQIREMSRGSADILSLMSYVNRQAIPRSLLQGDVDDITFNETFEPLISFSLVRAEIGGDTFELHRLVQVVLQHWLCNEGTDQLWKERAIERVAQKFPFSEGQYQHWPVCEALMSHADEVILHTTSSKECQLNCASILIRTACYLIERKGASGLAEQKSTRAREIRQQHFADDSDEIFETSSMLAIAYENQFKIKEAIDLQEFILKQQRKRWGPENSKTLVAMHNLAFSYHTSGRNQEAEDLLIHVVEVRERESGSEDLQFLISGNALVSVRVDRGKYEEAEKLGSKILKISLQCHGVENVHTLNAMAYLSLAHLRQKKFKEAKNLISQAIPPMTKVFGPSHLRTLDARICLAEIYYGQSKLDEAEELCTSCLDTARETYGPQHLTTLTIMNLLALIYQRQRKFIDALGLLKDVLDSYKRALGPNYPETLVVLSNIALCYDDMGEKEHAIQLMTEVYDKRREVLHANHPDIADSADWLAHWKREEEETEEEKGQEMEKRRRRKRARRHHT